jgi:hypothetical protein
VEGLEPRIAARKGRGCGHEQETQLSE